MWFIGFVGFRDFLASTGAWRTRFMRLRVLSIRMNGLEGLGLRV